MKKPKHDHTATSNSREVREHIHRLHRKRSAYWSPGIRSKSQQCLHHRIRLRLGAERSGKWGVLS